MRYTIHTTEDITNRMKVVQDTFGLLSQYLIIISSTVTYQNSKWKGEVTVEVKPGFENKVQKLIKFI